MRTCTVPCFVRYLSPIRHICTIPSPILVSYPSHLSHTSADCCFALTRTPELRPEAEARPPGAPVDGLHRNALRLGLVGGGLGLRLLRLLELQPAQAPLQQLRPARRTARYRLGPDLIARAQPAAAAERSAPSARARGRRCSARDGAMQALLEWPQTVHRSTRCLKASIIRERDAETPSALPPHAALLQRAPNCSGACTDFAAAALHPTPCALQQRRGAHAHTCRPSNPTLPPQTAAAHDPRAAPRDADPTRPAQAPATLTLIKTLSLVATGAAPPHRSSASARSCSASGLGGMSTRE